MNSRFERVRRRRTIERLERFERLSPSTCIIYRFALKWSAVFHTEHFAVVRCCRAAINEIFRLKKAKSHIFRIKEMIH
jgi:hypothetical protein